MTNGINWIEIDDSADKWTIAQYVGAVAEPGREFELVPSESGYRKLIGWLKQLGSEVRVVYEAGPCGYELYRKFRQKKISSEVAAPSLTPRRPGERVKTNRCDAAKLAKLYRAGELTLIVVPDAEHEALRDLIRIRDERFEGESHLGRPPDISPSRHSPNHRPPRITRTSVRPRWQRRESQIEPRLTSRRRSQIACNRPKWIEGGNR